MKHRSVRLFTPPRCNCWFVACVLTSLIIPSSVLFAEGDIVKRTIEKAKTISGTPELVKEIEEVIRTHPGHPDLLELKLWHARARQGLSNDNEHLRSVIPEFEKVAQEAGADSEIGFTCGLDVGYLLHYLGNSEKAYERYKSMEASSFLSGRDLQTDCRKVDLYNRIAQSALRAGKKEELRKYAKLVMAYPYLGIEDPATYNKFYQLYEEAGKAFVLGFADNVRELMSVRIYPSHGDLWRLKEQCLKSQLNPELNPESVGEKMISDFHISKKAPETTTESKTAEKRTEPARQPQSPKVVEKVESPQTHFLWIVLALGAGIVLVSFIGLRTMRKK